MATINDNYLKLKAGYLFPEIARRVNVFAEANPDAPIIRLGIGDVTEPLPAACRSAMVAAVEDMGDRDRFKGYGPEQGYLWLRQKIAQQDFQARGCDVDPSEIFISDGSKCDCGNILDIFGDHNSIAVTDPVYPVYVDTNVMAGHTGPANERGEYGGLVYLPINAENDFIARIPDQPVDLIYLCFPNNPTGAVASRAHLQAWVNYARAHGSIIFFDAAYEAFITDPAIPHSIYEIDGARDCAIEFRSFSKNAGFTGTRCALTVVPQSLRGRAGMAVRYPSTASGTGGSPPNLMGSPTLCSGGRRRSIPPRARLKSRPWSAFTWKCPHHSRTVNGCGPAGLRWRQCPLRLGENPQRPLQLGLL